MYHARRHVKLSVPRWLHEFDGGSVRIANINDALAGIRAGGQRLWFACGFPTRSDDSFQHRIEIVDQQGDVNKANIAGTKIDISFSVRGSEIFEQFNFVSVTFKDRNLNFSAGHAGDLAREIAGLMRAMRQFEAKNIAPKREGPLDIRDGEAGVISNNDAERHISENVQRSTLNVQRSIQR